MIEAFAALLRLDKVNFSSSWTIFDVGSRDGLQSIEFANAFPEGQVFAFECNPDTYPIAAENLRDQQRITLVGEAVNDYSGECTFYKIDRSQTVTPHADGNPGASSLFLANGSYSNEQYVQTAVTVPCVTLDDFCARSGLAVIDVIWMDLQGAELKALQGFSDRLRSTRYISIELTHREIYAGQPLFNEVDTFLQSFGFERISQIHPEEWFEDVVYRNVKEKHVREARVILANPWGGLGDNLQFSTLPEQFALAGYQVWLSRENAARNCEITDLLWARNPYIEGIFAGPGTIGGNRIGENFPTFNHSLGYIERIEAAHGLPPVNKYPKIYHRPQHLDPASQGKVLIDLGSISVTLGEQTLLAYVNHVLRCFGYPMEDLVQLGFRQPVASKGLVFNNLPTVTCESLQHYCSLLAGCRAFITTHSGAQSLAVSLRWLGISPKVHVCANTTQFNSRMYIYEGVEYFVA